MKPCVTGKKIYTDQALAEDALIDAHVRFRFAPNAGPQAVYRCDDCGYYHLTSRGPINPTLAKYLADGTIARQKEADHWLNKFKKR